ncbi:unnamed protein product [Symbiodinium sp. CCMP2456]|nr:unnamed protein product [Symbiodinium sp. CCMP2456]
MVTHVLARESHWVNWKGQGCREWEHDSLEMLTGKVQEIDAVGNAVSFPKSDKPKLDSTILNLLKEVKDFTPPVVQSPRVDGEGTPEPCALEIRRLGERALDRHEEDEDPANGIEDEYKAKYNKAFMWQSRRLFGRHHIRVYARKEVSGKTDFMDFVRSARNRNPPPEPAKDAAANDLIVFLPSLLSSPPRPRPHTHPHPHHHPHSQHPRPPPPPSLPTRTHTQRKRKTDIHRQRERERAILAQAASGSRTWGPLRPFFPFLLLFSPRPPAPQTRAPAHSLLPPVSLPLLNFVKVQIALLEPEVPAEEPVVHRSCSVAVP